jgi:HEPN domain-containing protein
VGARATLTSEAPVQAARQVNRFAGRFLFARGARTSSGMSERGTVRYHSTMPKAAILTAAELTTIDQLSFDKANKILSEAQGYLRCFDYDLAVRRAQEAFELYLKGVFRFLQAEYPTIHDVKKDIYALTTAFKQHQIEPDQIQGRQLARLVLANSVLHQWRLPAFYGDETLNVGGLFEESEAKLALSYAEFAQFVCHVVRFHVYQLAATAQMQK